MRKMLEENGRDEEKVNGVEIGELVLMRERGEMGVERVIKVDGGVEDVIESVGLVLVEE